MTTKVHAWTANTTVMVRNNASMYARDHLCRSLVITKELQVPLTIERHRTQMCVRFQYVVRGDQERAERCICDVRCRLQAGIQTTHVFDPGRAV